MSTRNLLNLSRSYLIKKVSFYKNNKHILYFQTISGCYVAQYKFTVLLMPNGPHKITGNFKNLSIICQLLPYNRIFMLPTDYVVSILKFLHFFVVVH